MFLFARIASEIWMSPSFCAMIDTGARMTVIKRELLPPGTPIVPVHFTATTATPSVAFPIIGSARVTLFLYDSPKAVPVAQLPSVTADHPSTFDMTVYVVDELSSDMLLGYDWLWRFGLNLQMEDDGFRIVHAQSTHSVRHWSPPDENVSAYAARATGAPSQRPSSRTDQTVRGSSTCCPSNPCDSCRRHGEPLPFHSLKRHKTCDFSAQSGSVSSASPRGSFSHRTVKRGLHLQRLLYHLEKLGGRRVKSRSRSFRARTTPFSVRNRSVREEEIFKERGEAGKDPEDAGSFSPARVSLPSWDSPNVVASVQSAPVYPPYLGSTKAGFTPYELWPPESVELLDIFEGDDIGNDLDKYAVPDLASQRAEEYVYPEFDLDKQPELATIKEVCAQFPQLFAKRLGSCDLVEHPIYTGDAKPIAQKARRIPHCWKEDVQSQLDDLLEQGIIRYSSSPYRSPCVFAKKKDGRPRICVDFRRLNEQSAPSKYPVPHPDFVQEDLCNAKVFTTLDLRSGYWQIPLREQDIPKTAFCPGANMPLFEFTRMPFGLHSATATFQSLMDQLFGHLPFVKVYLDDILISSPDMETHRKHLEQVFDILAKANLTLNAGKCTFAAPSVHYLGHVFDKHGMRPDPDRVETIANWAPPTTVTEIKQFLGLVGYYREFIPRFASIALPIQRLTTVCADAPDTVAQHWSTECDQRFGILKQALIDLPALSYPDFDEPFEICCDASNYAIGAVLQQAGRPLAFFSQTLSGAQLRWHTFEKEGFALFRALQKFRHYVLGHSLMVTIFSDHRPLQHLAKCESPRVQRWILAMQDFRFQVRYKEGVKNVNADALSRPPRRNSVLPPAGSPTVPAAAFVGPAVNPAFNLVTLEQVFSRETLREAQEVDDTIRVVRDRVTNGELPQKKEWRTPELLPYKRIWNSLRVNEGLLVRLVRKDALDELRSAVVLPTPLRQQALDHYHDVSGHFARDKSMGKMLEEVYWPSMHLDYTTYQQCCRECQVAGSHPTTRSPLLPVPVGRPWHTLAIDYLTIGSSSQGYKYLVVLQDYFTKWAEAFPLVRDTMEETLPHLLALFARFGPPARMHSDQGSQFEGQLFKRTLEALNISRSRTTVYHPSGNGLVERLNGTLIGLLRRHTALPDWPAHLPALLYRYNSSVHASTGYSPYMLMFAREPPREFVPITSAYGPLLFDTVTYGEFVARVRAYLDDEVDQAVALAAQRYKALYDRTAQPSPFYVGARVFLRVPSPENKLAPRWEADWVITDIVGSHDPVKVVRIRQQDTGKVKTSSVDHLRLDPVQFEDVPPGLLGRVRAAAPSVDGLPPYAPELPADSQLHSSVRPSPWSSGADVGGAGGFAAGHQPARAAMAPSARQRAPPPPANAPPPSDQPRGHLPPSGVRGASAPPPTVPRGSVSSPTRPGKSVVSAPPRVSSPMTSTTQQDQAVRATAGARSPTARSESSDSFPSTMPPLGPASTPSSSSNSSRSEQPPRSTTSSPSPSRHPPEASSSEDSSRRSAHNGDTQFVSLAQSADSHESLVRDPTPTSPRSSTATMASPRSSRHSDALDADPDDSASNAGSHEPLVTEQPPSLFERPVTRSTTHRLPAPRVPFSSDTYIPLGLRPKLPSRGAPNLPDESESASVADTDLDDNGSVSE